MKTNVNISSQLVTETDNQKAVIYFFFLKSKYRTSVFYDYKPEKLAILTGVSVNTIRKYVGWLKRNGFAAITDGHLWLRSIKKISPEKRLIRVDTKAWTSWKQFENRVYAQIIKLDIKKQTFHYSMKRLPENLKSKKAVTIYRKYLKTYGKDSKEKADIPMSSVRQIARLFNRSKSWAQAMLKTLERMGYITRKQVIEKLCDGYLPPEYYSGKGYIYYNTRRNAMILHHGTLINVTY